MNRQKIEERIKEIEAAIVQQGQYVQQMNNQILMFHGAKEEYNMQLKVIDEQEKHEATLKAEEEAKAAAAANPENPYPSHGEQNNEERNADA